MYRETIENRTTTIGDIAILVLTILLIGIVEIIATIMSSTVPSTIMIIMQGLLVLVVIVICVFFYCARLVSVRYTFVTGDCDDLSENEAKLAKELGVGTFVVEKLVGDSGNPIFEVAASEMIALLPPHTQYSPSTNAKVKKVSATLFSKHTAHSLVFLQDGVYTVLYIHPCTRICELLEDSIAANK